MRLGDLDDLKEDLKQYFSDGTLDSVSAKLAFNMILRKIDNAPTVTEMGKPFITECRNTAIEKNLPLYFVYYEETGIFEVYITETRELFEKRHCSKHLSNYDFEEIVTRYLDAYSEWKGGK